MSSFSLEGLACFANRVHTKVNNFDARGGASIVQIGNKIIVFGGADREQSHFQDLLVFDGSDMTSPTSNIFESVHSTGDIPMPRSGHSVVGYGKYMFLFGGIDFSQEAVFNDLYILDLESYEWGYVGESGTEVIARNSHSMAILKNTESNIHYLVVYGGASPELGPLNDTVYSSLPPPEEIDPKSCYVTWETLPGQGPSAREMQGTCSANNEMIISGGRNLQGQVLSDVWVLSITSNTGNIDNVATPVTTDTSLSCTAAPGDESKKPVMQWTKMESLTMSVPRCAHGAAMILDNTELCLFGGFVGEQVAQPPVPPAEDELAQGSKSSELALPSEAESNEGFPISNISADMVVISWSKSVSLKSSSGSSPSNGNAWRTIPFQSGSMGGSAMLEPRFGLCLCAMDIGMLNRLMNGCTKYKPLFKEDLRGIVATATTEMSMKNGSGDQSDHCSTLSGLVVFGGVSVERDFGDLWLIVINRSSA